MPNNPTQQRVAIAGLGAIGLKVAQALDAGLPGLRLVAVAGRDPDKTAAQAAALRSAPRVLGATALAEVADIIVDCAPSATFAALAGSVVDAGKMLMTVNAGALLRHRDLVERARRSGARIVVPTTLVWGREDRATPLSVAEAASTQFGWPLHVIDDAADDPTLDQPEVFLKTLREALAHQ